MSCYSGICLRSVAFGGQLLIRAISASAAESYAMTWLRIPQTHVASVAEVTESEPVGQR
jgi:hypothetical protein